jgi:hypothetical protein
MTFSALSLAFVIAVAAHNFEEAVGLPAWSQEAGGWHAPVRAPEFRFAVVVLTALAAAAAGLAAGQGPGSFGAYVLSGYALAMLLNVAMPHLAATLLMRRYMPGTATAVLLNLPVTALLLRATFAEGQVVPATFLWAGPAVVLAILASIPVLFALGRRLFR